MKENYIHVCFVIDESGSMSGSENDVVGGFQKVIDEQKAVEGGTCSISLYKFSNDVKEVYRGKDVFEVKPLEARRHSWAIWNNSKVKEDWDEEAVYSPGGGTAMFDGIGTAINNIGTWLSEMPEDERPSKNLVVIMTDGEENLSKEFTASKVKEMIKHQEDKYNWTFVYMGTDITTTKYADGLGFKNQSYTTRADHMSNYRAINSVVSSYRCATGDSISKDLMMEEALNAELSATNSKFCADTGIKLK